MLKDIAKSLEAILDQKRTVAAREKELIAGLNRVLPQIGYMITPVRGRRAGSGDKTYTCPQCEREFGHWLHLGRHISATHKTAASRAKSSKSAASKSRKGAKKAA